MYSLRRSCHVVTSNKHASHILMAQFCSVVQLLALVDLVHEQSPPVFHFSLRVFWWSQLEHYQSLASSGTEVQSINSDTSILPGYILQYNIHIQLQYNILRPHEVSDVMIREIHYTLLSLLHTFLFINSDQQMLSGSFSMTWSQVIMWCWVW